MTVVEQELAVPRTRRAFHLPRSWTARVGVVMVVVPLAVAFIGPFVAPYTTSDLAGIPFSGPERAFPLGTDHLGRDTLSLILLGGWRLTLLGFAATLIAYVAGSAIGLFAGYTRGRFDSFAMRVLDVPLVFPAIVLVLLLATVVPGSPMLIVVTGVAIFHLPGVARVVRSATIDISTRSYVEASIVRGESTGAILRREILPNIAGTIAADAGPRVTVSMLVISGFNFLGFGVKPPASDWALMIGVEYPYLNIIPLTVAVPALLIAALNVGLNLVADAIAREQGVSLEDSLERAS